MTNYTIGTSYERRFINNLLATGEAIRGARFYHSEGPTDVWWVDKRGNHIEAQLKYSKNKPYISKEERKKLRKFARSVPQIKVLLVMKKFRKKEKFELIR